MKTPSSNWAHPQPQRFQHISLKFFKLLKMEPKYRCFNTQIQKQDDEQNNQNRMRKPCKNVFQLGNFITWFELVSITNLKVKGWKNYFKLNEVDKNGGK